MNVTFGVSLLNCMVTDHIIIFCVYLSHFRFSFLVCHRISDYMFFVVPFVVLHYSPNGFVLYAFTTFHSLFLRNIAPFNCYLKTIRNEWLHFLDPIKSFLDRTDKILKAPPDPPNSLNKGHY